MPKLAKVNKLECYRRNETHPRRRIGPPQINTTAVAASNCKLRTTRKLSGVSGTTEGE